jgi:hypothetical protein
LGQRVTLAQRDRSREAAEVRESLRVILVDTLREEAREMSAINGDRARRVCSINDSRRSRARPRCDRLLRAEHSVALEFAA